MASREPGLTGGIPYVDLAKQHAALKREILDAVAAVLEHGRFILGPEVEAFERAMAARLGVRHAVGVASGTDALVLALKALGIGPQHEVITVSHSFVATASAIRLAGAEPVFVDVEDDSMLLDPARLPSALSPRSRAVLVVHLNGFPCAMDAIEAFCREYGLALVEDCAQALGARWRGRAVGSFGVGCFSLHPLKPLSACGDGGFVTTQEEELAERLRQLRNLGLRDRDHCDRVAGNTRLDTLQAAILLAKLPHLDGWLAARRARAQRYREALSGRMRLPPPEGDHFATYSAFVVRHPRRDALRERLVAQGIDARIHYPLAIHQQAAFAGGGSRELPVTERVVSEILSLPVSAELSAADQERVIEAVQVALREVSP
jgi:dTDP-4-amino-4,6-dideoxygalactose transaminase